MDSTRLPTRQTDSQGHLPKHIRRLPPETVVEVDWGQDSPPYSAGRVHRDERGVVIEDFHVGPRTYMYSAPERRAESTPVVLVVGGIVFDVLWLFVRGARAIGEFLRSILEALNDSLD